MIDTNQKLQNVLYIYMEKEKNMRLRNIPGAKEAVMESAFVVQRPQEKKGGWAQVYPQTGPIHIEVGMGKGQFLMELARRNPQVNYLGIEMYDSVLLRALQRMAEIDELPNLLFMREDARLLPEIFRKGEVEKIYLNFSDPWPKARHAKRRLTSREFLNRYERILVPEGVVEFKTDNRGLFEFSLEEIREAGWRLLACTYDLHNDAKMCEGNVMTEYEEKFSSLGNPIYKLVTAR
ncbi:tRNA (guanine-N(7)-)-methyltransferase [uncultured Blautia sp.]|uniref:tRNA (guanine-N(7)-)-methyltransferase n=2 Tax=Blautia hydrogenotrophica TaxID=53443 RepID=C0CJC1_BLAHS|nr:tRNA (guanine-N(7)-)-methyltransferase [Blautia hydrogenotrophica DSM 10507]SCH29185.1 tRNA (guanine-N(7)-)-methyltransferase [uncultured Blautia sp.]